MCLPITKVSQGRRRVSWLTGNGYGEEQGKTVSKGRTKELEGRKESQTKKPHIF